MMAGWDDPVGYQRRLEAERDMLMRATWSAYVETGADTDGDNEWHCSPEMAAGTLLLAVRVLAKDYDDSLDESTALERRLAAVELLAAAWEHQDRYFPSGPQYAVDLRAALEGR